MCPLTVFSCCISEPYFECCYEAAGIIQEGAQVRRMMLQYPAWWTRSAERLEQVTADYERLGFNHDTIKFVFAGEPIALTLTVLQHACSSCMAI